MKLILLFQVYTFFIIKDLQLLIQNDDDLFPQLIPGCLSIIQNTCWECEDGWILNQLISSQGFEQCIPICGDSLIVGSEQCDDGINPLRCLNCQYQCTFDCLKCVFGVCQECIEGYQFNENMICEPICGDGLIIPNLEYCDKDQEDGCQFCQFELSVQNCTKWIPNSCFQCDKGYESLNNICTPVCGDKIIIQDYEECDDGNDQQYDGCYECKYQCRMNCLNCVKGVCLDKCNHGEMMVNYKCESICGNSIVTGLEECDDGNNIQYDGCHQCQYSCPLFCDYCEKGICLECYSLFIQFIITIILKIKQLMYQCRNMWKWNNW